jgi:hypothetical protein
LGSICGSRASAVFVAHRGVVECNGENVEGWADDGEKACADVEGRFGDVDAGYLKGGCDAGCDEGRRNEVLGDLCVKVECTSCDCQGRGHDRPDHGEGMLETEEQGEEDGDLIGESVEWRFIIFVLAIQGPDVGCDEVEIVLRMFVSVKDIEGRGRQT